MTIPMDSKSGSIDEASNDRGRRCLPSSVSADAAVDMVRFSVENRALETKDGILTRNDVAVNGECRGQT